jgi:hypothetical protein
MDAEDFTLPPLDVAVEKLRATVSVWVEKVRELIYFVN